MFKKTFFYILIAYLLTFNNYNIAKAQENINTNDIRQQAIALYTTGNFEKAYELLDSLGSKEKTEEDFLLMANISQEIKNDNAAIQYLNKAIDKNNTFYKAYYNLGCIFASKKSYLLAANNFELAIKYNKNLSSAYYNLANCQMKLKNYDQAKKNLIKALNLNPQNKDYYFNLAYCYKELGKEKQAQKILDVYNNLN